MARVRRHLAVAASASLLASCGTHFVPKSANPYETTLYGNTGGTGLGADPVFAAAAGVIRRAGGDCFVACLKGTACNYETGMCDPLPCRGECSATEICDQAGMFAKCVQAPDPRLNIHAELKPSSGGDPPKVRSE
jgi:hypothetical protein